MITEIFRPCTKANIDSCGAMPQVDTRVVDLLISVLSMCYRHVSMVSIMCGWVVKHCLNLAYMTTLLLRCTPKVLLDHCNMEVAKHEITVDSSLMRK